MAEESKRPQAELGTGPGSARASRPGSTAFLPRWLELFLGKQALRFCPSARHIDKCEGCRLRVLCTCAHGQLAEADSAERKVWAVLAGCGGAVIFYALIRVLI